MKIGFAIQLIVTHFYYLHTGRGSSSRNPEITEKINANKQENENQC